MRERAPDQVRAKLEKWGLNAGDISEIIQSLEDEGFLDEKRFAVAYAHDKHAFNQWGKIRIRLELRNLGIDEQCLEEGLESISESNYTETIRSLISKKWSSLREEDDFIRKNKTAQYLIRKGFESEQVWKNIGQMDLS